LRLADDEAEPFVEGASLDARRVRPKAQEREAAPGRPGVGRRDQRLADALPSRRRVDDQTGQLGARIVPERSLLLDVDPADDPPVGRDGDEDDRAAIGGEIAEAPRDLLRARRIPQLPRQDRDRRGVARLHAAHPQHQTPCTRIISVRAHSPRRSRAGR
jgi:hypothetical protein